MKLEYRQLDPETFRSLANAAQRRLYIVGAVGFALWMAPIFLARLFVGNLMAWTGIGPAGVRYWWPIGVSAYSVVAGGAMLLALYWNLRNARRLMCPQCRKPLLQTRRVVLTTGKCGRCGTRVLSTPAAPEPTTTPRPATPVPVVPPPSGTPLLTLDEFRELAPRIQNKAQWVTIGTLFGGLLAMLLAMSLLGDEVRATTRASAVARNVLGAVMLAALVAVVVVPIWLLTRITNDPRVRCPACRKSMLRHQAVAIATGKCGHCGAQALTHDEHPV